MTVPMTYFTHFFSLHSLPRCGCNPELNFCVLDPNKFLSPNTRILCSSFNVRDRHLYPYITTSSFTFVVNINVGFSIQMMKLLDFNGNYLWYFIYPSGNFRHERNFDLLQSFQNIWNFSYFQVICCISYDFPLHYGCRIWTYPYFLLRRFLDCSPE